MSKISYADCLLNAALQLTASDGYVPALELQARAAQAEAWLHLAETLKGHGWVDVAARLVSVEE